MINLTNLLNIREKCNFLFRFQHDGPTIIRTSLQTFSIQKIARNYILFFTYFDFYGIFILNILLLNYFWYSIVYLKIWN
jgi:hypothetical protein